MAISRRTLLTSGGAALAASSLGLNLPKRGGSAYQAEVQAKNIIFMVADGMAAQVPTMADQFQKLVYGRRSYWHWLMNQEWALTGLQETSSLSSVVTDSAAAAAAWGGGRLQWNGQLNQFPDGTKLTPLTEIMSSAGVKCGLVTTTRITHATPSGFSVSMYDRGSEDAIAEAHLNSGVDILLGGGLSNFDPARREDKKDLFAAFAQKGFQVVRDRQSILDLEADKILGLFSPSHVPYSVDWDNDQEISSKVPTLAEMTRTAIRNLRKNPKGFLLQVEGGKVDHAGHASDLPGLIYDQIAFEEAVKVAIEFALEDGETLVVITTDHATGGPSLNGAGSGYFDSTAALKSVQNMKASFDVLLPKLRPNPTVSKTKEAIKEFLDIELSDADAAAITESAAGRSPFQASSLLRGTNISIGNILANYNCVTWTSSNHTSDHCLVTAVGPGAEFFRGVNHSYTFFNHLLAMKGLKHENPTMTFEEAAAARERARELRTLSPDVYM